MTTSRPISIEVFILDEFRDFKSEMNEILMLGFKSCSTLCLISSARVFIILANCVRSRICERYRIEASLEDGLTSSNESLKLQDEVSLVHF